MDAFQFLADHGASVLFWVILVEQIGLPIPAIPFLVAAGALVGAGKMSVATALLVPVAAHYCRTSPGTTSAASKAGGCWGSSVACPLNRIPAFETRRISFTGGPRALLLAKFIPGLSTVAPPLAGIVGMSAATFVLFDIGGTLIWAAASAGVGALFSDQLEQLAGLFDQAGGVVLTIVLVGLAGFIGYKFYHRQKFLRHLKMAKISVEELKRRLDAGDEISVVDVRHPLSLELDPDIISGSPSSSRWKRSSTGTRKSLATAISCSIVPVPTRSPAPGLRSY